MQPKYIRVRARSAYEGWGIVGPLADPAPACFPIDEVVMIRISSHHRLCAVFVKRFDDVIGGNGNVRGAAFDHS
jgi:hypothetical protein